MIVVVLRSADTRFGTGATLRNQGIIQALSSSGAQLSLFGVQEHLAAHGCGGACAGETEPVSPIVGDGLTDPYRNMHCLHADNALRELLTRHRVERVVVCELALHRYFATAVDAGVPTVVMDMHNLESKLAAEMAAYPDVDELRQAWRPRAAEAEAIGAIESFVSRTASLVLLASPVDERDFRRRYPAAVTAVVPNSVPFDDGTPPEPSVDVSADPQLIFPGSLDYFPNVEAAYTLVRSVFPMVRTRFPGATLTIAGRRPYADFLRQCSEPGVRVVVDPPEMLPLLSGRIMVVPLTIGGGSRIKLLEAFRTCTPVVSSGKGAEGLAVRDGEHYWRAEPDADSHIEQITAIVKDPQELADRTAAAYAVGKECYSWSAVQRVVERVLVGSP